MRARNRGTASRPALHLETLEDRIALSSFALASNGMPAQCACPFCTGGGAAEAAPYVFTNGTNNPANAARWSQPGGKGSQITITYSYTNLLDGGLGGGLERNVIRSAIEEALGRWANVAPINFVEVADSGPVQGSTQVDYSASGRPMIRFTRIPIDGSYGTLGYAYYPGTSGLAGDVFLDQGENWAVNPSRGIDLIEVATHELGHALGLAHQPAPSSGGTTAVMNPYYGGRYGGPGTSYLFSDDVAGIQALYGSGRGSVVSLGAPSAPPPPTPTNVTGTSFTDSFNRANSPYLGAEWSTRAGGFQLLGNAAVAAYTGTSLSTLNGVASRDVAVSASVNIAAGSGVSAGLVARYSGPGESNFYLAEVFGTGSGVTLSIYRNLAGSYTRLASTVVSSASGTLRFEAVGSSLKLFLNDTLQVAAFDTVLEGTGSVGIRGSGSAGGVSLDNFSYQKLTLGAAASLPFSDSFSSATRGQLSDQYNGNVGNVRVAGGFASNNTTLSIATLRGVAQRDQALSATVNIAAGSGKAIGLMARYSGPGEGNFYLAEVYGRPGMAGVQVNLYLNLGGRYRLLASSSVASAAGTLRFEVAGSSQKVFLNDTLVVFGNDTTLEGAGSAGFRMSGAVGTVTLDNFAVSAIAPTPAPSTYTDDFATATRGQLGGTWSERAGNFAVTGGQAVNSSGLAIATLNGLNAGDMLLTASVNITAGSGQSVGLLGRYTGSGEGDGYLAEMYATPGLAGVVTVNLYRRSGGSLTRLATTTTSARVGTLEFGLFGSSLSLRMNGVALLSASDSMFDSATAGLRLAGPTGSVAVGSFAVAS